MYQWDLSPFYLGFDDSNFEKDLKLIFEKCEDSLKDFENKSLLSHPKDFLEMSLRKQEEIDFLASRVFGFISLNSSADTQNMEAKRAMVRMQPLFGRFALLDNKYQNYIKNINNLDQVIESSPYLLEYRFIIHEAKKQVMHTMSEELEVLTSDLVQNGSRLWSQMQRHLTSIAEVELNGEKMGLSAIRNLAYDNNPQVRKQAYDKELELYKTIEEPMSFAISGLKGEVNTLVERRHFKSALDEALFKSRMKKETLDALLEAMRESFDDFRRYLKHKAKLLGHKNGLPWYDLFAPMGKSDIKYTIEEAQAFILKQFSSFGEELRAMAERAFTNNWIDYLPRKGKVGGAFCMNCRTLKQSRILSNFDGTISDIITLAHELGHAYHGEQIFKEAPLNSSYTMPVAETASTFCETITKKAAYFESNSIDEKIHILEQELQDATQVILDIYSRFLFEQDVFESRKKSIPNAKELNEMMIKAQKEAYGDGLDQNVLNSGMWINKSHYYRGSLSFYNFPYAFGLLFAKGIYAKYKEIGPSFVEKINMLLRSTGKMSVEDVALLIDIDITKKDFWQAGLKTIKDDIDEFIKLTSGK